MQRHRSSSLAFLAGLTWAGVSLAGSLTPPGPPAPTMKALDVVEPRFPISSLPFTITTAGSYYLTRNLTMSGSGNGITFGVGPTTIDLNGFTLDGNGSGNFGILATAIASLEVRNGTVANWSVGISGSSGSTVLDRVTAQGCLLDGASIGDATVTDSLFLFNGRRGLAVSGVGIVTGSRAGGNGDWGMVLSGPRGLIDECIIDGNGYSTASGGAYVNDAGAIRHSSICNNTGPGISAQARTVVAENNVYFNSGDGIFLGAGDSRVESNQVTGSSGYGVHATVGNNTVIKNSARSNLLGNFSIGGTPNVAPIDTTGTSPNPWVNFSF